jgi:hypothetical protein
MDGLVNALVSSPEAARLTLEVAELIQEESRLKSTIENLKNSEQKLVEVTAQKLVKVEELTLLLEAAKSALMST